MVVMMVLCFWLPFLGGFEECMVKAVSIKSAADGAVRALLQNECV